ncbi:helix-turn-helix domain-containing protein [Bacillus sp. FJAT-29814]|uniref:helix-turn-helix domain-containing protein n=1 Tax=Bacillus sp. FJAT-29814 TaxID=1729688 RepID=UPI00082A3A4D|nr:helix-turn-helix domain-containing protein [Bacillus sp. FJAT-29814]
MTELGNRLKEARLAKDLSLDDLQSMTKIQKRYLIGIEEGNYSSMPGNFYVRAFIKQYAEALGLNPEEIFETYKNEIPPSINDEMPQLSRVKTHKNISPGNSKIFDFLPKILIAVFVIGVAGLFYYFISTNAGDDTNEAVSQDNEPVKLVKSDNLEKAQADEKEKAADKEKAKDKKQEKSKDETQIEETPKEETQTPVPEAPKQELTVVQTSGRNSTFSLANADKFVVKVVSRGESWVSIKNGIGKSFFQGTLKAGTETESQTYDLTPEAAAVITVGRTLDADIYVNDQKLEYAVPPAEKVRQDITIQFVPKNQ